MRYDALWSSAAGLLAMAVALGVAEFTVGALSERSLIVAIGDYIIDGSPRRTTRIAINLFGQNDKTALIAAILVASFALGAAAGLLARRSFILGASVIVALGVAGALAGADAPTSSGTKSSVAAAAAVTAGVAALWILMQAASGNLGIAPGEPSPEGRAGARRRFLRLSGGALGISSASLVVGRWGFGPAVDIEGERASLGLPTSGGGAPVSASGALEVDGISPLVTPNADFYRIDTVLSTPGVTLEDWRLKVTGLVDRPLELTYQELVDLGTREETITLSCVSNEVGGDLVGNAVWTGVPLKTILDLAGAQPEATQIVARSVDDFTTGFRTEVALDGRASMVAVTMNGEVLPALHGFPARMIVPGLYGYVSATKWLEEIELTRWDDFSGYWITRGWAKEGPIKTQSRIDVPSRGQEITEGRIQIGGIAWAGIRSIEGVEVRIVDEQEARDEFGGGFVQEMTPDFGEWQKASLSVALSTSSWRQWVFDWDAKPGTYRVEVRATDGLGSVQTHERQKVDPDGATGYHGFKLKVQEEA